MAKPLVLLTVFSNGIEIRKKPVQASTRTDLEALARDLCPIVKNSELTRFFVYSDDFDEFVDADEDHAVAQKEKFQLYFTSHTDSSIKPSGEREHTHAHPETSTSRTVCETYASNISSVNYSMSSDDRVSAGPVAMSKEDLVGLHPEELIQQTLFGKDGKDSHSKWQSTIFNMAFNLGKDNPASMRNHSQPLITSTDMLPENGDSGRNEFGTLPTKSKGRGDDSHRMNRRNENCVDKMYVAGETDTEGRDADMQSMDDELNLYEAYENHDVTLKPEDVMQQSMIFGQKGKGSLNRYQSAINEMAFKLAMDNPALLTNRNQLLIQSRMMLHASGYLYARCKQSRSKMFGTPYTKSRKEKTHKYYEPQEIMVGHEEIVEDEDRHNTQDQLMRCERSKELNVALTPEDIMQQSMIFGKKGKGSLTKYHVAINSMALKLAKDNPSLLRDRGQLLVKSREMLHKTGYMYAGRRKSRSKVFGSSYTISNEVSNSNKMHAIDASKEDSVDEMPVAMQEIVEEMGGEKQITRNQQNLCHISQESDFALTPEDIRQQSVIFGKKENSRLTKYQVAINKMALKVAMANPVLLRNRGRLLMESRKMLHESGYLYARCKKSRSKVFGTPYTKSKAKLRHNSNEIQYIKEESLEGIEGGVQDTADNLILCGTSSECDKAEDVIYPSMTFDWKGNSNLAKPQSGIIKMAFRLANNKPFNSEDVMQQSKIYGQKGKGILTKYQSAINEMAFKLSMKNPTLLRNRGRLLVKSREMLHKSGYAYARSKKSRSKVFGTPCAKSK